MPNDHTLGFLLKLLGPNIGVGIQIGWNHAKTNVRTISKGFGGFCSSLISSDTFPTRSFTLIRGYIEVKIN